MERLRGAAWTLVRVLLVAAVCAVLAAPPKVAEAAGTDYSYWFAYAQDKIYPTTTPPASARLAGGRHGLTLKLSGAQAEFEGRQILIRPTVTGLRDIWMEPSDLTMTDGDGVLRTIDASNVSVFKVHYVTIKLPSLGYSRKGLEPDPLLPMVLANGQRLGWRPGQSPNLALRGATAGSTQPYYVLYRVPDDAAPGVYRGSLKITCTASDGTAVPDLTIPVSFQVYPFSVAQRTLKTSFGMHLNWAMIANSASGMWLGTNANPGPEATRVAERTTFKGDQLGGWFKFMSDHRITPQAMLPAWESGSDWAPPTDNGDMVARDAYLQDYLGTGSATTWQGRKLAFNTVKMPEYGAPSYVADPFTSTSATTKAIQYYRTMKSEVGAENLSKTYVYPVDEPSASKRAFVEKYATFIHANIPGLKFFVTTDPVTMNNTLLKNVDIYGTKLHFFYRDYDIWVKKILAAKKSVWIYSHATTWQNVVPNYLIDQPLTSSRVQGWIAYDTKAEGLLYFSINAWREKVGSSVYRDAYADPLSYRTTTGGVPFYANGDGSLVYPGYYPALGLYVEGSPPVGSLRMEGLRDGLEDYEYLKLISAKYGTAKATAYSRRIVSALPARKPGVLLFPTWEKKASVYNVVRTEMAAMLVPAVSAEPYTGPPRAIVPRRPVR